MTGIAVIGAGLPRTGTFSLCLALERIGLAPCHHMLTLIEAPALARPWIAALQQGATAWPETGHPAAVDLPACLLVAPALARNPDLRVILTLRDPEPWADSMMETVMSDAGTPHPDLTLLVALCFESLFGTGQPDRDRLIAGYRHHVAAIRDMVPPRQLLGFRVEEGWGPLCRFLSRPLPDAPFPHANSRADYARGRG